MNLVYTNSRDRAIRMAICLDGVILQSKQKVIPSNFDKYKDDLNAELDKVGYLRTFFRGSPFIFIYSNGRLLSPFKMAEYDPAYSHILDRPVPYIPEQFRFKFSAHNQDFKAHKEVYKNILSDASTVIDATTDDYDGNIAFSHFARIMDLPPTIRRVKPRSMTPRAVVEAFNAMDAKQSNYNDRLYACQIYERLDWLVSCNATNTLMQERIKCFPLPLGLVESLLLLLISRRDRTASCGPAKALTVTLEDADGTVLLTAPVERLCAGGHEWEGSAFRKMEDILRSSNYAELRENTVDDSLPGSPLLSVYDVQIMASQNLSMPVGDTTAALLELYDYGYITWPSSSRAMPWTMKPVFADILPTLSVSNLNKGSASPQNLESFTGWSDPRLSKEDGAWGIIITDKLPSEDMAEAMKDIYGLIVQSNLKVLEGNQASTVHKLQFHIPGERSIDFTLTVDSGHGAAHLCKGTKLTITKVEAAEGTLPSPVKESELLADYLALVQDSFYYAGSFFNHAFCNLRCWKQIDVTSDGEISLTAHGRDAIRYVQHSLLGCNASPDETLAWFARIQAVSDGAASVEACLSDITPYVTDICMSLQAVNEELKETGGLLLSEALCPVCGKSMEAGSKGNLVCSDHDCRFMIPHSILGHTLTKREMADLLTKGYTSLIDTFISTSGRPYSARLVVADGTVKRSYISPYGCPICGAKSIDIKHQMIKCTNGKCPFSIGRKVCGYVLQEKDISALLQGHQTDWLPMSSNTSGKPFKARLSLDLNSNNKKFLRFDFGPGKDKT